MRTLAVFSLAALALITSVVDARPAVNAWVVVAPGDLDPRLQRQLEQMAVQDQAAIVFRPSTPSRPHAVAPTGGLAIDLIEEKNIETFLDTLKREAGSTAVEPTAELAREGYLLQATYPRASAPSRFRITAATAQGFHNALLRIPDVLAAGPLSLASTLIPRPQTVRVERNGLSVVIADFPSFAERGVVEGFYGTPWTQQDRLEVLRFEGAHSMNVYYYAPKDDPYHRKLWRQDYPPEDLHRLGELVDAAHHNFVDFCFAISPSLTMAYLSEPDFHVLTNKLASVSKLGVSCFALFLDDVPQDMQDPQDKAQFKTLAQAHIFLTNKLFKYLKEQSPKNRLALTPTTYTNEWGSRDYIQELGAGVDPGVSIVWTGPKTFSPTITAQQAREWGSLIHRPPLVWDNFPVNDATRWCRYLGPMTGRDAALPSTLRGLFSNPMSEAHASLIPLQTVADYLWNASAYDPVQSEQHAVVSQYGQEAPRLLAPFLETYGTYYWDDGNFTALFQERHGPIDVEKMRSQLADMNSALARLANQRRMAPLLTEIAPAVKQASDRLPEVMADSAFRHLPDGRLEWDENDESLAASRVPQSPNLGDYLLDAQATGGAE